ncbi:MAG: DNA polymerase III subunit gamma/tau, partial [Candidatus Korobacteraceae bacterium]
MSYQVLARKYRPQKFSDVIGQDHVTRTLKNAIEQQRIAHGYIFSGHRGIGKTTIARILAMALNCRSKDHPVPEPCGVCDSCVEIRQGNAVDVIEIDAATNRGIDEIRELRDAARYRPARDRYKIWILDEAHQITDAAFNALLKTLEEPPSHVIFMMATTQPEDIPQTIRSRCQHFSFHAVSFDDIVGQRREIAKQEGITADDNALAMLAEAGDGSMRDALSIMDQAIASCGDTLSVDVVRGLVGTVGSDILEDVMDAVARNSSEDVLRTIDRLLVEGQSAQHFARQMVRFLRNTVVAKVAGSDSPVLQISSDERARVSRVAERFSEEDLTRFLQIMLRTHSDLGYKQEQRFHLELGLLKLVHAQRLLPLEQFLSGEAAKPGAAPVRNIAPSGIAAPPSTRPAVAPTRTTSHDAAPSRTAPASPFKGPSPFEADRNRKSEPKAETPAFSDQPSVRTNGFIGDTATPAAAISTASATAIAVEEESPDPAADLTPDLARNAVLAALEDANQQMLAHNLEAGEWSIRGHEVSVKVAMSQVMVDVALGDGPKRIVHDALVKATG